MGLLNKLNGWRKKLLEANVQTEKPVRLCRFERLERRDLLSADPLHFGAVYYEDAFVSGTDNTPPGDLMAITYSGGADGTQLTTITIDLDPQQLGMITGGRFFDTAAGGMGASGHLPLTIVQNQGIDQITFHQTSSQLDGTTTLTISFVGFDAGDKLVLGFDVDEVGRNNTQTPTVEGIEFEGSTIKATFAAPTYQNAQGTATFFDQYDLSGHGLNLPPDSYMPPGNVPANDYTAGGVVVNQQHSLPVTIAGTVYHDTDGDNTQDTGENGIGGVHLALLVKQNGTYVSTGLTTTTDANGDYQFTANDRGDYRVVETQPDGYLSVGATSGNVAGDPRGTVLSPDVITDIHIVGGEHSVDNDFAEAQGASLEGSVYHDADNDGIRDAGEAGIGGTTVHLLDADGNPTGRTTVTDANGHYIFENLLPGTYQVSEVQPGGFIDGLDTAGSLGGTAHNPGDNISGITILSGQDGTQYNFGELLPGTISGHVHADLDGDCVFDPEESGVAGVTIQLLNSQGQVIATTLTDANGNYSFNNLPPGTYGIHEVQPAGYFDSGDHPGSAGGVRSADDTLTGINLGSDQNAVNYNFCEIPPASISGQVHLDLNGDCTWQQGETLLPGVTIHLRDSNGNIVATTQTDANGQYSFTGLRPGTYSVEEVQPTGLLDGCETVGSEGGTESPPDTISGIVLTPGANGTDYNFSENPPSSIEGQVHVERDGDCILDPGEPLLAGVTVQLLDEDGNVIATTVTGADGKYKFEGLAAGTYGIREIQPAGYLDAGDHPGSAGGTAVGNDTITGINLGIGQDAINYNFCEVEPASISGYVFQDGATIQTSQVVTPEFLAAQRDGVHTADDTPIAGVHMQLLKADGSPVLDSNGQPVTAVTDANGFYKFDGLYAGEYRVVETQPSGYIDFIDTPGSTGGTAQNPGDTISGIQIGYGQQSTDNNFSEVNVTAPPGIPFQPPSPPNPPNPAPFKAPAPLIMPVPAPFPVARPFPFSLAPGLNGGGAGGGVDEYTWHLSIIDGGHPRDIAGGEQTAAGRMFAASFDADAWTGNKLDESQWILHESDSSGLSTNRTVMFGLPGGTPVVGDFNGDGRTDVGVFYEGNWFIDLNGNGTWDHGDLWAKLGKPGDRPITGDWDGDGKTDIGVFGPSWSGDERALAREAGLPGADNPAEGTAKNVPPEDHEAPLEKRLLKRTAAGDVRADVIDHVFDYGQPGDIPLAGDWNGDGTDKIGVYRNGEYYLDMNGNGRWDGSDKIVELGMHGLPIVGDFNGDGTDELGVYRDGKWHMDTNGDGQLDILDQVFEVGGADGVPVVGDWNGTGIDQPGVYRPNAGRPASMP